MQAVIAFLKRMCNLLSNIPDVFHASLVRGATFDGDLEIPHIVGSK